MDKYLKVGNSFDGGIAFSVRHSNEQVRIGTHAINSHDELVVEVERLRRQLAYAFMAGWEEGVNGMECDEAEVASVEIAEQFSKN